MPPKQNELPMLMEIEARTMFRIGVAFIPPAPTSPACFWHQSKTFPLSISGPRGDKPVPIVLFFNGLYSTLALGNVWLYVPLYRWMSTRRVQMRRLKESWSSHKRGICTGTAK